MYAKKILALILTACLLLGCLPVSVLAASFDDTEGHWGEEAIDRWSEYGILTGHGDGTFKPDDHITRAETATALAKTLGLVEVAENDFTDLDEDWYTEYILQCVAYGAMSGYADGTVVPNRNITREEAALLMAGALGIEELEGDTTFDDDDKISDWAKGAVKALQELGIVQGDNNQFSPDSWIDRAALVTILHNAVAGYIIEGGTYSDTYDGIVIVKVEAGEEVIFDGATIKGNLIISPSVTGESAVKLVEDKTVVEGDIISLNEDAWAWVDGEDVEPPVTGAPDPGPAPGPGPSDPELVDVEARLGENEMALITDAYDNGEATVRYVYVYTPIEQVQQNTVSLTFGTAAVEDVEKYNTDLLEASYARSTVTVKFPSGAVAGDFDYWPNNDGSEDDNFDIVVTTEGEFTYYICFYATAHWNIKVTGLGDVSIVEAARGNETPYTVQGSDAETPVYGSCVTELDDIVLTIEPANGWDVGKLVIAQDTDTDTDGPSEFDMDNLNLYWENGAYQVKLSVLLEDSDWTAESDRYDLEVVLGASESKMHLNALIADLNGILAGYPDFDGIDLAADGDSYAISVNLDAVLLEIVSSLDFEISPDFKVAFMEGSLPESVRKYFKDYVGFNLDETSFLIEGYDLKDSATEGDLNAAIMALLQTVRDEEASVGATIRDKSAGPNQAPEYSKLYDFDLNVTLTGMLFDYIEIVPIEDGVLLQISNMETVLGLLTLFALDVTVDYSDVDAFITAFNGLQTRELLNLINLIPGVDLGGGYLMSAFYTGNDGYVYTYGFTDLLSHIDDYGPLPMELIIDMETLHDMYLGIISNINK